MPRARRRSLLLLARDAGLPYPQYRTMNAAGAAFATKGGATAASRAADPAKARLRAQPRFANVTRERTAFDEVLYRTARARFEARLAAEGERFAALVRAFRDATTSVDARKPGPGVETRRRFVGGLPPRDAFMITAPHLCPTPPYAGLQFASCDYGTCDGPLREIVRARAAARGARDGGEPPPGLTALKRYVPCEQANCTKIAADSYSCWHVGGLPPCEVDSAPDGWF